MLATGQQSSAGKKPENEDSMGLFVPDGALLTLKGAAAAIADGVSAASAGREAAEICVNSFLDDYFATPAAWSVATSVQTVLTATNRWLYGRGRALPDSRRGYVSTFSAVVLKSRTAHVFHVGDTRIHRLRGGRIEQLTTDHKTQVGEGEHDVYLARAVGMDVKLDVDYQRTDVEVGDVFLLTTDGIHEYLSSAMLLGVVDRFREDPQACCDQLVAEALEAGSTDNLTCQMLRVDALSAADADEVVRRLTELPLPPPLSPGMKLDGYEVLKTLHESSRSHVYLVKDVPTGKVLVMKTPSANYAGDPAYLERFAMEHWIAARVSSLHVVRVVEPPRPRAFLYNLMEYVDGITLEDWMARNPSPDVHEVVQIMRQVSRGLLALHRRDTLHQDIKPANVMVASDGTAKIIDLGSCSVAGIEEIAAPIERDVALGTVHYSAPEFRLGQASDRRADYFSLGSVCYEMLTGKLPYGEAYETARGAPQLMKLPYRPAYHDNPLVPLWLDGALEKCVRIDRSQRYAELSEWMHDLEHPNPVFMRRADLPLAEREPVRFWKTVSAVLACLLLAAILALLQR